MSSTAIGGPAGQPLASELFAGDAPPLIAGGPLEEKHLRSAAYRNAAQQEKLTSTHWHIALSLIHI